MDEATFEQAMNADAFPRRAVLITFDDGYRNFVDQAAAILKSYEAPSTLFVVSDKVGGRSEWDVERGMPPLALASWDELEVARSRYSELSVGSHSASHRFARDLSPQELHRELRAPIDALVSRGFPRPTSYAFPYGNVTQAAVDTARELDVHLAFTTRSDVVTGATDPYRIPRLVVRTNMSAVGLAVRMIWLRSQGASPLLRTTGHVVSAVLGRLRGLVSSQRLLRSPAADPAFGEPQTNSLQEPASDSDRHATGVGGQRISR